MFKHLNKQVNQINESLSLFYNFLQKSERQGIGWKFRCDTVNGENDVVCTQDTQEMYFTHLCFVHDAPLKSF